MIVAMGATLGLLLSLGLVTALGGLPIKEFVGAPTISPTVLTATLVLLAAAGLALKSFWHAQNAPLGFNPRGVLTMSLSLPKARYPTDEKIATFNTQLIERISAIPGASAAAIGANVPFDDNEWDSYFHLTGTPKPPPGKQPRRGAAPARAWRSRSSTPG